jgi:predicted phage-related endonuclease/5-methylcytosine-specific restriction endonuclease McrA
MTAVAMTREAWLLERSTFIGSSESPAICGVGYANQSAFTIWLQKTGQLADTLDDSAEWLRWGRRLEPVICEELAERTGYGVVLADEYDIRRSADHSFIAATPDAFIFDDPRGLGIAELKNVGQYNARDWQCDEPPLKYNVQIHHQMLATGATWGIVAGLVGGNRLVWHEVTFNARFATALVGRLYDFWQCVINHTPPAIDGSMATAQAVARLHADDDGTIVGLPAQAAEWDRKLARVKLRIKQLEAMEREYESCLKAAIGSATAGALPSGECYTFKTQERAEYVCKATKFRVLRRAAKRPKGLIEPVIPVVAPEVSAYPIVTPTKRRSSYRVPCEKLLAIHPHCRWCGRRLVNETATLDHIVPLAVGGPDREENWCLACEECNHARGDSGLEPEHVYQGE